MTAMFDARCPKCRRRIAWAGEIIDRPACTKCGHRPDNESLQKDQAEMTETLRLMALHPRRASVGDLARMRELAGISLAQASVILKVNAQELLGIESGLTPVSDAIADKMSRAYGCGR